MRLQDQLTAVDVRKSGDMVKTQLAVDHILRLVLPPFLSQALVF